jgi:UDP-glucose 4-epimerase
VSPLAWVIGRGGLLGSHLERALGRAHWKKARSFEWQKPTLRAQLDAALSDYFADARTSGSTGWRIFWAAGAGVVGSSAAELAQETATFSYALDRIAAYAGKMPGALILASSADGVYGECPDIPCTEQSRCMPVSDYGREKLRQEERLRQFSTQTGAAHLVARISNLYGPRQNLRKAQGLISHLVRSLILGQPVHVYVPLDTLRDYAYAEDCANAMVRAAELLSGSEGRIKIFASEQPRSISALIGIVSQMLRKKPLIIHAASHMAASQPRNLTFRSEVWRDRIEPFPTALAVGVHQVYRHMSELTRQARLC